MPSRLFAAADYRKKQSGIRRRIGDETWWCARILRKLLGPVLVFRTRFYPDIPLLAAAFTVTAKRNPPMLQMAVMTLFKRQRLPLRRINRRYILNGGAGNDYLGWAQRFSVRQCATTPFWRIRQRLPVRRRRQRLPSGGDGADTYWFDGSWGSDTIVGSSSNSLDQLSFGSGIAASSLSATLSGDTLTITAANYGSITIQNWNSSQLNSISFNDGTSESFLPYWELLQQRPQQQQARTKTNMP